MMGKRYANKKPEAANKRIGEENCGFQRSSPAPVSTSITRWSLMWKMQILFSAIRQQIKQAGFMPAAPCSRAPRPCCSSPEADKQDHTLTHALLQFCLLPLVTTNSFCIQEGLLKPFYCWQLWYAAHQNFKIGVREDSSKWEWTGCGSL